MTIYLTSDSHLWHNKVLEFEDRPFGSVEEMNEGMIDAWNSVVRKTDTVYHLGDFCFGNVNQWLDVLNQLRGNIILIKGNHDKGKIIRRVLNDGYLHEYHSLGIMMVQEKMMLNLSHYPLMIGVRPRNFSIHGHIHSSDTGELNHINVGVDSSFAKELGKPFGTPIELSELMQKVHELNPLVEEAKAKEREENGKI